MNQYTKEILQDVKALLATPDRWCQDAPAMNAAGVIVPSNDYSQHASRCLATALGEVANTHDDRQRAWAAGVEILHSRLPLNYSMATWNDAPHRVHSDIIDLLDACIADCEPKEVANALR